MPHNLDKELDELLLKALIKSGKTDINVDKLAYTVVNKSLPKIADILLQDLKKRSAEMLVEHRKYMYSFEQRLFKTWKKPFDLFEMFLVIAYEAGEHFNNKHREQASKDNDYLFEVLTRMHARGCQIAHEILTLSKSGYADGAHARWRALHEIAVVSFFIKEQGKDVAKRFIDYEHIETYKQALEYQKHCSELGYEPFKNEDMDTFKANRDKMCKIYGKDFAKPYGWIPDDVLKNKDFSQIEEHVQLDHLRPYYKMACNNVHAGIKGIRFKLGLYKKDMLLAGATNYGMADPIQNTALSLHQLTACLLTLQTSLDSLMILKAMEKLTKEICKAACKVQFKIEDKENKLRKRQ